jgi:hypothetical protein
MADRYWVGGTGTWNSTSTTNWAASSGGASGASVPTAADNVFFDANSNTGTGAFTVTMATTPRVCNDFTASGLDGTMTLAGTSIGLTVSGSLTFQSTNFTRTYTGTTTFNATTTGKTVTTNGVSFGNDVTFDGVGGGWTLGSALTTTITTTLTNGTLDLNNLTLTARDFVSSNSNTRTIAFGTGNITCTGTGTVWNTATTTNLTTTGTQVANITSSGSTAITVTPGAGISEANSISFNFTGGTYSLSFMAAGGNPAARNVDFTGFAGTWSSGPSGNSAIYGNLKLSTGMTITAGNTLIFGSTSGLKTITSNGVTINFPITFNGVGGTWELQDALTLGSTRAMTLTNGTLDLSGKTCTVGTTFTTAAGGTKNLTFNGGTLVCPTASTTAFNNAQPSNFSTTAGTGTGTISMTAATAKTFVGGGSTFNCTLNQGGLGTLTITGANTFSNITNTVQPAQITFPASTTNTFTNFSLSGTAGNLITLRSSSSGTRFTLSDPSGTISLSYLDIQDSAATGGATWIANDSTNSGNNTGWSFIAFLSSDITASATVVGNNYRLLPANGLMNAAATVSGNAYGLGFINGLINSTASVSGNAVDVRVMNAIILCNANVVSNLSIATSINALINNSASLNANLKKVGEEWITSQPVSTTWFIQ